MHIFKKSFFPSVALHNVQLAVGLASLSQKHFLTIEVQWACFLYCLYPLTVYFNVCSTIPDYSISSTTLLTHDYCKGISNL